MKLLKWNFFLSIIQTFYSPIHLMNETDNLPIEIKCLLLSFHSTMLGPEVTSNYWLNECDELYQLFPFILVCFIVAIIKSVPKEFLKRGFFAHIFSPPLLNPKIFCPDECRTLANSHMHNIKRNFLYACLLFCF